MHLDDLKVARRKANLATVSSDIDTPASDMEKAVSRERRRKKFDYESSDEADEACHLAKPPLKKASKEVPSVVAQSQLMLPPPPPPTQLQTPKSAKSLEQKQKEGRNTAADVDSVTRRGKKSSISNSSGCNQNYNLILTSKLLSIIELSILSKQHLA